MHSYTAIMQDAKPLLKILWPCLLVLLAVTACGAARAPEAPPSSSAELDKLDSRCQQLLAGDEVFYVQAQDRGFITRHSQVLLDLQLEPDTSLQDAEHALNRVASIQFIDVGLRRASVYIASRDALKEVSRLPFVRYIRATRKPMSR